MARLLVGLFALVTLSACSSAQKARQAEREKLSASTGMLCDFVNGDDYQDVEVELNLQMARRCDSQKSFSITNYKNASEVHGVLYCCSMVRKTAAASSHSSNDDLDEAPASKPKAAEKKEAPKPEAPKADAPKVEAPKEEPKAPAQPAAPAAEAPKTSSSGSSSGSTSASKPAPQQQAPKRAPANSSKPGDSMNDLLDD